MPRKFSLLLLIVGIAMLFGAALRLERVADRTMSHIEMYVPNIPLGTELSVPKTRTDLWSILSTTFSSDTHPPVYFIFMWFVTKLFGTGTLAMRIPSVLFGVACIGLVFWLGDLIGQRVPGCVAACLVAFNGYIIVWDRTARMYSMVSFLGLLSTILVILVARSDRRRGGLEIGYFAVTLLGLGTEVFLWAVLGLQMLWVLGNAWDRKRPFPRILKLQILIVILASPLLAAAAYQSVNQVIFASNVPVAAREFIEFMFLLPGFEDTWAPGGAPTLTLNPEFLLLRIALFVFGILLLVLGIRRLKPRDEQLVGDAGGSFTVAWTVAGILGVLGTVAFIVIAAGHDPKPTLRVTKLMTVLPLVLLALAVILQKSWDRLNQWRPRLSFKFLEGAPPLVWLLAVGPFVLLIIASFLYKPVMDSRRLLFLSPYLLLALAAGLVQLGQRSRWLALSLVVMLGGLHGFSAWAYSDRLVGPIDFKEFAGKLIPHIQDGDLIFLRREWYPTPILYYVKPARYHILASGFEDACRAHPDARVWTLLFHKENFPAGVQPALEGYRQVESINVYEARAVLYCRGACQPSGQGTTLADGRN